jgi:hypothetical protein
MYSMESNISEIFYKGINNLDILSWNIGIYKKTIESSTGKPYIQIIMMYIWDMYLVHPSSPERTGAITLETQEVLFHKKSVPKILD